MASETVALENAIEACIDGNPVPWMETFLEVETKENEIVPFRLGGATKLIPQPLPKRLVGVKARQVWATSYFQAAAYAFACCLPGFKAGLVLHEDEAAERAFRRIHFYHDHLPEKMRPRLAYDRSDMIELKDMGSSIFIGTSKGAEFGRSGTLNMLILSEFGHYSESDARKLVRGAIQSVPMGGWVVIESTPNGLGTPFHTVYANAKEGKGGWQPVFMPWFAHDEYRISSDPSLGEGLDLSPEELELVTDYGLRQDQIRFYRWKKGEMEAAGEIEMFAQEFPNDDVTCWLTSQEAVYSGDAQIALRNLLGECVRARLEQPPVWKWKLPAPTNRYLCFADVAEGLERGNQQYAVLGNVYTGEIVAKIQGNMPQDSFARMCVDLCAEYGQALLVFERNVGSLAIDVARRMGYTNVYRHGTGLDARVGFPTSVYTKPKMVQAMQSALASGEFRTPDEVAVRQLLEYRVMRDRNGLASGYSAPSGRLDDGAMACMGFNLLRQTLSPGSLGIARAIPSEMYPRELTTW